MNTNATKTDSEKQPWVVLPHGDIEELAENLWRVTGSIRPQGGGLPRHMIIARRDDGGLIVHNSMALADAHMAAIDAKGAVKVVIAPSLMHRIDVRRFHERYRDAKVMTPKGARAHVEKVCPVDVTYDEFESDNTVSIRHLKGTNDKEGVMSVRSKDGVSLVFNDVMFNQPHVDGVIGMIVRLIGSSGGPKVTPLAKMAIVKDKAALRDDLLSLATDDVVRLIPGHGDIIAVDAKSVLKHIASGVA